MKEPSAPLPHPGDPLLDPRDGHVDVLLSAGPPPMTAGLARALLAVLRDAAQPARCHPRDVAS